MAVSCLLVATGCSGGGDGADRPIAAAAVTGDVTTTHTTSSTTWTPEPAPDLRDGRPYSIETTTLTLEDLSRPTRPVEGAELPSRTLVTTLYLPESPVPVPLIVFSHGFGGHPAKFERLHRAWAAAGYAVAAPAFPLTNAEAADPFADFGDWMNQPADAVFVLDQLLTGPFADRFDAGRVGAAGLSLGGLTTTLAAIDATTGDPRFRAAIVMAALAPPELVPRRGFPVLVMHGDADALVPFETARATFDALGAPSHLVTLHGGRHANPFEDTEDQFLPRAEQDALHPVVDATTVAFWDAYLLADPTVVPDITARADRPGLSSIESHLPSG